jgi:hypothetical protein
MRRHPALIGIAPVCRFLRQKTARRDVTKWVCSIDNVGRDNPAVSFANAKLAGVYTGTTGSARGVFHRR